MMMDTVKSDVGEGVAVEQSDVRDPIEELHVVSRANKVLPNEDISELNQQLNPVNNCLATVHEHDLLLHVDSTEHMEFMNDI
jgi:hypothetical protein